jgi:hypothetical protein
MADFWNRVKDSLDNLVTLKIITSVGPVPAVDDKGNLIAGVSAHLMRSRINLLQGDIVTEIDPAFVTGELKDLRDFHMRREQEGSAIVDKNIEVLRSLLSFAVEATQREREAKSAALPEAGGAVTPPRLPPAGGGTTIPPRTT